MLIQYGHSRLPMNLFQFLFVHSLIPTFLASTTASNNPLNPFSAKQYPLVELQKNAKKPPINGTGPSRVLIGIYIESMGNFQAADMSFDVDLYLYSHWRDPSLKHDLDDFVLVTDPKVREQIWLPDLYFANARTSKFHDVTIPNFSLFIDRDGNIAYSTRVTLNVACNLELANYPMDKQICGIRMVSYAYVESQVNVTWFATGATRYNPEIGLPEFKIVRLTADICDGSYMYAIMANSFKYDKFSCLEAVIHLDRQIGYHVVQSFIPTGLIVMISWVSFWIDRRAVPARVTLSFTTMLSLSTLDTTVEPEFFDRKSRTQFKGNGLRFNLPQVAYAKAIDFWFGSCMFFVFLSLVEFAIVNSYMRNAEKYERLATYSAKKELTMNSEDGNGWLYSDDCSSSSSTGRTPIIRPRKTTPQKTEIVANGTTRNSGRGGGGGEKRKESQQQRRGRGEREIGSKLRTWTGHAIAIPALFGHHHHHHTNHVHQTHEQSTGGRKISPYQLMRHPSIPGERILTVEHFEQLAEKRISLCSTRSRSSRDQHNHHNHYPPAAAELRSIDADESDSLMMSPPLAQGKNAPRRPPPPPPAPKPQMDSGEEEAEGDENNNAATEARKRTMVVPAIHPWPPTPSPTMTQQQQQPLPRKMRKLYQQQQQQQNNGGGGDNASKADLASCAGNPMATNHFLRMGFRFSRKGLMIDKWSRFLFPLAFTLWNIYYWTYYLWYIQRHQA